MILMDPCRGTGREYTYIMRSHTMHRSARVVGFLATALGALSFATTEARAGTKCDPDLSSACSRGTTHLTADRPEGLPTTIETPWMPSTGSVQVKASLKVDPVKNGGPLFSVDMARGAVLDATWGTKGKLTVRPVTAVQTDGVVRVRHTLTPTVQVKLDLFGLPSTMNFPATTLVNRLPGAKFNYDSAGQKSFQPWGLAPVATPVEGPTLDASRLFSVGFDILSDAITEYVDGSLALNATTRPTFTYRTTKVTLSGGSKVLASATDEAQVDWNDGDYAELYAMVEGEMTVAGQMDVKPYVNITRVYGFGGLNIGVPVGTMAQTAYSTPPLKVAYAQQIIHIPLPNVHAPEAADLKSVPVGTEVEKTVTLENTGELAAEMSFASKDPEFTVPTGKVKVPAKGKYEMRVTFRPSAMGPASTEITVTSTDPDHPVQTIKLAANGAVPGKAGAAGGEADEDGSAGAAGCSAAGSRAPASGLAGFGALGLTVLLGVRRRRA